MTPFPPAFLSCLSQAAFDAAPALAQPLALVQSMLTAETETVGGDSLDAGDDEDEELILRIPLELCVPSNITLYNLKRVVSAKLAEAKLEPRQDPMSMFLGLNGQVCADPVACPLRMLVPGSVVSLVADLPEAHEVSRLGLCLNAFQLMQVQWSGFPTSRPTGSMVSPLNALGFPRKLLPDDVMAKRRQELYKTQLCTNFTGPSGYCSFGERCHFAHGKAELRVYGKPEVNADARAPHKDEEESKASKGAQWNSKDTEWKSNRTGWNWSDKPNGRNWESWDGDNDKWKYDNSDWKWKDWNDWSTWDRESGRSAWRSDWSEWRSEPEAIRRRSSSRRSRSPEASGLVLRAVRRSRSRRSRRRPRRDEGNERGREMRRRRSRSRGSGRR